jgi:hypothetical protein
VLFAASSNRRLAHADPLLRNCPSPLQRRQNEGMSKPDPLQG